MNFPHTHSHTHIPTHQTHKENQIKTVCVFVCLFTSNTHTNIHSQAFICTMAGERRVKTMPDFQKGGARVLPFTRAGAQSCHARTTDIYEAMIGIAKWATNLQAFPPPNPHTYVLCKSLTQPRNLLARPIRATDCSNLCVSVCLCVCLYVSMWVSVCVSVCVCSVHG